MGAKQHPSFFRFHLWASAHSYTYSCSHAALPKSASHHRMQMGTSTSCGSSARTTDSCAVTARVTLLALHLHLLLVSRFLKACWASLL